MQVKEKSMKQNKTVLEKIGINNDVISEWKIKRLKITYPMKKKIHYFESQDGSVFIEAADKYVPPLSKQEIILYTKNPKKFQIDFLRNVHFYFQFHTFLFNQSKEVEKLTTVGEKLSASLALMYLFLSAMDHHYYHFDRYLVYQDYPETPIGYWWEKLKDCYLKAFGEKVTRESQPENYLKLLARDPKVLQEIKKRLSKEDVKNIGKILTVIKLFEDTQQKEYKIVSGYPVKEDLLLKSGFGLWENICKLIKKYPNSIQEKYRKKILELIEGHPITSTRELLLVSQLKTFKKKIISEFEEEIKRWL